MTPLLRQAIKVLQLPALELACLLRHELECNPLLELQDDCDGDEGGIEDAPEEVGGAGEEPDDWLDYFCDSSDLGCVPTSPGRPHMGEPVDQGPTLQGHLRVQVALLDLSAAERALVHLVIDSLDGRGYLGGSAAELAEAAGVGPVQLRAAIRVVQSLEPTGLGAADLRECLFLQLQDLPDWTPGRDLACRIVSESLDRLAAGHLELLARELDVRPQDVREAAALIRGLDPHPGGHFSDGSMPQYIFPDVIVERVGREYVVTVNESGLPRLVISPTYRRLLRDAGRADPDARKYVRTRMRAALSLLRSMEQRRLTLYRLTQTLVALQQGFFEHGIRQLQPLTLRDIADRIGVHESTVSRATAGKYMQTPRGTFPFRFFFDSSPGGRPGAAPLAAAGIRRLIRDLVRGEDPAAPYSDGAIAAALQRQGVDISRRTVAKYRQQLGILSRAKRRC